ncbi:MalY/PatB family protein [Halotalea alkalilenta]|uniref:MalY/PatB family protein n=1 Tax=Halotalea alkalilenta TaxID=376489 RepID=UPI0004863C23|nr:PatB family C-S lyase [Halotalea alkalilenta]
MEFDFTTELDRRQYPSTKWQRFDEDTLPMWVADMDFAVAPAIQQALSARVGHAVFGYANPSAALKEALCDWSRDHYDWQIDAAWQTWLPGVVPALHIASLSLTEPGDEVMTLTPIYPPFLQVGELTGRVTRAVPMRPPEESEGGRWEIDFDALERAVTPRTRLLLWCHPHNPTGRVFEQRELERLADFVERHDLIVCSDELHCDLILESGRRHRPLARAVPRLSARTITLWAASKTFNVAGLAVACAVIEDPRLRARFARGCIGLMPSHNVLGLVATEAAYRHGEPWRQALLAQLRENVSMLEAFVARWPGVGMSRPEATFLAWLDCRAAGLGESPQQVLLERGKVGLSDGADFGWPGFVRINLGTQPSRLQEGLSRLDSVLATVQK